MRGGLRHLKVVEHGQQFLQQCGVGGLRGLGAFARGALFEIFKIGGRAQQPFPMLVGLGGARLQFGQLLRRGRNFGFGRVCFFFLMLFSVGKKIQAGKLNDFREVSNLDEGG